MHLPSRTECRLLALGPRLRRQLERLYGSTGLALWPRLEAILRERAAERPAAMVALDEARLADPDWFVAPTCWAIRPMSTGSPGRSTD